MVSTEELDLLRAVDRAGGEAHFKVIKRMVLPYRPRLTEEMVWSLSKAGYLELSLSSGVVKLTETGEQALGKTYRREVGKGAAKSDPGARH